MTVTKREARTRGARTAPCLLVLLLASACGGESSSTLNFSDPVNVGRHYLDALGRCDFEAMRPLATTRAREQLRRELEEMQVRLADRAFAEDVLEAARERNVEIGEEDLQRAVEGTTQDAWRLMLRLFPELQKPQIQGMHKVSDTLFDVIYVSAHKIQRPVRLVLIRGHWYVDAIQIL